MLLVLYCYMRKFPGCEPPNSVCYLPCPRTCFLARSLELFADSARAVRRQTVGEQCLFYAGQN